GYDADGNLVYKTDKRHIQIDYFYDELHRLLAKAVDQGAYFASFTYDQGTDRGHTISNGVGRLVEESNTVDASTVFSYDAMGRVQDQWTRLPSYYCASGSGWCNNVHAEYDLAGQLTNLSYP